MAKILIVDDDPKLLAMLQRTLTYEGFFVVTASDGKSGLQQIATHRPDLVVLDWLMPGLNGIQVVEQLRKEKDDTLILMLTARGQEMDRVMGLELGADDYIVKPFNFRELVARIHAALRRREIDKNAVPTPTNRLTIGEITLDRTAHQVWRGKQLIELTPREFDLLATLMEHLGQAIARQDLLDMVWGKEWVGDPRTLDVHIRGLREKLGEAATPGGYIETVRSYGYRFVDPTAHS